MSRPARYAKGLAKREEILNTALEVIARTGYGRTSVRELASAVGLSQAGLLHYFASKEELFAEILLKRDRVDHDRSEPEAGSEIAALASIVRHNAEVPGLVQLYARFSVEATEPGHAAHEAFVRRYAEIRALLSDEITTRQQAGTLSPELDARKVANLLIAVSDGLQAQWLLDPDFDMADHLDYLIDLLGLGRPAEG
ncbi:MAG: TetR family transcriptional regulator [Actinobacteria bacterium HGW-Actinobacteria-5]|nr:MAG: TetR family transcriptional regulator [Actinobacteria bacterium HGW-Actinobacteria-5]